MIPIYEDIYEENIYDDVDLNELDIYEDEENKIKVMYEDEFEDAANDVSCGDDFAFANAFTSSLVRDAGAAQTIIQVLTSTSGCQY